VSSDLTLTGHSAFSNPFSVYGRHDVFSHSIPTTAKGCNRESFTILSPLREEINGLTPPERLETRIAQSMMATTKHEQSEALACEATVSAASSSIQMKSDVSNVEDNRGTPLTLSSKRTSRNRGLVIH